MNDFRIGAVACGLVGSLVGILFALKIAPKKFRGEMGLMGVTGERGHDFDYVQPATRKMRRGATGEWMYVDD